jgi:hypothetical protein
MTTFDKNITTFDRNITTFDRNTLLRFGEEHKKLICLITG